jgi:phage terminase large subunit
MLVLAHVRDPNRSTVCVREVQKSLAKSVKRLIEQKIRDLGVSDYFDVTSTEIRTRKGRGHGVILFQGMSDHTADSIKSLEGFDCAWVEEAQSLSQRSLELLRPTIRRDGAEIWFTWNPQQETDPVDRFLRGPDRHPSCIVVEVNYLENPWLNDTLREEAEYDKRTDPEKYGHVWLGQYIKHSQSRVFKRCRVAEFDAPKDAVLRFGVDWGFSPDPTTLVRCFIEGRKLFVEYEAYQVELEVEDTAALFLTVPESERWELWCASDRPERVKSIRRAGFKAFAVPREQNSVQEGVDFLCSFDEIVIHPRCVHALEEFRNYSRKIDPLTGAILPILEDRWNHIIDAIRYALDRVRRMLKATKPEPIVTPPPIVSHWGGRRG